MTHEALNVEGIRVVSESVGVSPHAVTIPTDEVHTQCSRQSASKSFARSVVRRKLKTFTEHRPAGDLQNADCPDLVA